MVDDARNGAARVCRTWYRGDFHVHSRRSHGAVMTPDQLVDAARAAGLDFLAVTEHNTTDTHDEWLSLADDTLHIVLGQEVVTDTDHWLALGIATGQPVDPHDGQGPADVHRAGGVCVVAHPFAPYPSGTFARSFEGFDAVEVWNGRWTSDVPWQADNPAALAKWADDLAATRQHPAGARQHPAATRQHPAGARRRPAVGNSDAHLPGQLGTPQTVVRADSLTTGALLGALRAGRCWIAESADVALSFTASAGARHADIGDHLTAGDHPVTVTVEVGGVPGGTITLHTDRGQVLAGAGTLTWETDARRSSFVRAEVRHPGGHPAALTNPIFLG